MTLSDRFGHYSEKSIFDQNITISRESLFSFEPGLGRTFQPIPDLTTVTGRSFQHSDDTHGPCKASAAQRKRLLQSSQQAAATSLLRILQTARRHRQHTSRRSAGHIVTRLLKQTA